MKKTLLSLSAAVLVLSASAESKLDLGSRARLRGLNSPVELTIAGKEARIEKRADKHILGTGEAKHQLTRAFITLNPGYDESALVEAGADVKRVRDGIALAEFPIALIDDIQALPSVKRVELEKPIAAKLDRVRPAIGVDRIHSGDELPQAYTGKGVVCGIVDGGFDPNHINFLDEKGNNRIKQFTYFRPTQSGQLIEDRVTGAKIREVDTENSESFHATHTTGIMAGGYRGKVSAAVQLNAFKNEIQEIDNPYYGIAYGSDIATASAYQGMLSDQYIALGIETILDYAYGTSAAERKPLVVNLSLGSNVGAHDGSSAICRYLDAIIADKQVNTIVCISAGNEGDLPIALSKTLADENDFVATGLYAAYNGMIEGYQNPRQGLVYIYSDTDEPFDLQAMIINKDRESAALRMPLSGTPEGASHYWCSDEGYIQDTSTDEVSAQFARYLEGYVGLNAEVDAESGRYYAVIDFLTWDNVSGSNAKGNYVLCFQVSGKAGQRISIYGDGGFCNFTSYGMEDYSDGEYNGTINDIACGKLPIIVGSYNTRDDYASMNGGTYGYQGRFLTGRMSPFTSFGTLNDGRNLPNVCAPGATIISSANDYYLQELKYYGYSDDDIDAEVQARVTANGRPNSFFQCVGTSMAAPAVAGSIALWLEAYPELTAEQAKQIAMETAVKDDDVAGTGDPIQWGAGKFDAYAGLKRVLALKSSGIDNVAVDTDRRLMVHRTARGVYEVSTAAGDAIEAAVYDIAGRCVARATAVDGTATVDLSAMPKGVYVINAAGESVKIHCK